MFMCNEGVVNLAGGIIRQSIDDYERALILADDVKEHWMPRVDNELPKSVTGVKKIIKFNAGQTRAYLEDYFKSDEFLSMGALADLNYKFVIQLVLAEIDEYYDKACRKNRKNRFPVRFRDLNTIKNELQKLLAA